MRPRRAPVSAHNPVGHRALAASQARQEKTWVWQARKPAAGALRCGAARPPRPGPKPCAQTQRVAANATAARVHVPVAHFAKTAVAQAAPKRALPVVYRPLVLPAGPQQAPKQTARPPRGPFTKGAGNDKQQNSKVSTCPPRPPPRHVAPQAPAPARRAAAFDRLASRRATAIGALPPLISSARVRRRHRRWETAAPPPGAAPQRHPDNSGGRAPLQINHPSTLVTHHESYRRRVDSLAICGARMHHHEAQQRARHRSHGQPAPRPSRARQNRPAAEIRGP